MIIGGFEHRSHPAHQIYISAPTANLLDDVRKRPSFLEHGHGGFHHLGHVPGCAVIPEWLVCS
jgi:hypothetical protein